MRKAWKRYFSILLSIILVLQIAQPTVTVNAKESSSVIQNVQAQLSAEPVNTDVEQEAAQNQTISEPLTAENTDEAIENTTPEITDTPQTPQEAPAMQEGGVDDTTGEGDIATADTGDEPQQDTSGNVAYLTAKPTTIAEAGLTERADGSIIINKAIDLVRLSLLDASVYQNKNLFFQSTITESSDLSSAYVEINGTRYFYQGLGSAANPYSGSFAMYQGASSLVLTINQTFFNAVSNQFSCGVPVILYLPSNYIDSCIDDEGKTIKQVWNEDINTSVKNAFAEEYYLLTSDAAELNLKIVQSGKVQENRYMKGVIGTIKGQESPTITVSLDIEISGNATDVNSLKILSNKETGCIVGTLEAGVLNVKRLVVPDNFTVKSNSGNCGGIAGSIAEKASLIIPEDAVLTCNQLSVEGIKHVGGLAGSIEINSDRTYNVNLRNISLSTTKDYCAGYYFGYLKSHQNAGSPVTVTLEGTAQATLKSTAQSYGGFVGHAETDSILNTLEINGSASTKTDSDIKATNLGGLVGKIGTNVYLSINGTDQTVYLLGGNKSSNIGGAVGTVDESAILNINTIKVSTDSVNYESSTSCGGIVGKVGDGSAVRMTGTIDLSAVSQVGNTAAGIYVGKQGNSLVYSDNATLTPSDNTIDEIGNYGGVIRQGNTQTAKGPMCNVITWQEKNGETVAHTITVRQASATLTSREDFAALAIYLQSKGAFGSFADGTTPINDNNISADIQITQDINMTGTGIWGLLRDNDDQYFSGTIDGNQKIITITPTSNIYRHTMIGLVSQISNETKIQKLAIAGNVVLVPEIDMYYGGVVAKADKTLELSDVTCEQTVKIESTSNKIVHAGGLVGKSDKNSLKIQSSTKDYIIEKPTITSKTAGNKYLGGLLGSGNTCLLEIGYLKIDSQIIVEGNSSEAYIGGIASKLVENSRVSISNLIFEENCVIQATASNSCGGLFGNTWTDTNVTIQNVTVNNATVNSSGTGLSGGLVATATGYWKVGDGTVANALNLNSFRYQTKRTDSNTPAGLLIGNGKGGLYLEILPNGYDATGANVTLESSCQYFDELVGASISTGSNGANGQSIISVAVDASHSLIDTAVCNTYQNKATYNIAAIKNKNTRYYYNLDAYRESPDDPAQKLLLWSVYTYAHESIREYFVKGATMTVTGNVDLRGYSYYPVDYANSLTLTDADITFDFANFEFKEAQNKKPSDNNYQHYGMHTGLFRNSGSISLTNISLSGNVGRNNWSQGEGSGVIICGLINGTDAGNKAEVILNGITLKDLYIYNIDNNTYAPLLIKRVGSYTKLTVKGVKTDTTGSSYDMGGQTCAASSLFGEVGYINSDKNVTNDISVVFSDIHLDGRSVESTLAYPYGNTKKSIFSQAIFMKQFMYLDTGFGQYNFTKYDSTSLPDGDDSFNGSGWTDKTKTVTYGYEISNTDSGRNADKQHYYTSPNGIKQKIYDENTTDTFFQTGYLRYVGKPEEPSENFYELDVNLQLADEITGCGTYEDPYVISSAEQLQQIANLLADGTIANMTLGHKDNTGLCGGTHTVYTSQNDGTWSSGTSSIAKEDMRKHLQSAYYKIAANITMGEAFNGLGIEVFPFQGVIYGENSLYTITLTKTSSSGINGGLISYANGCVIKNLTVDVGKITITANTLGTNTINGNKNEIPVETCYGGIIGIVQGGDNIIENATVNGSVILDGKYAKSVNVGGFAGLVKAGGVIFRGTENTSKLHVSCKDKESDVLLLDEYVYANPFIGRVLDAYAIAESAKYKDKPLNGNKNYQINYIEPGKTLSITDKTITVMNANGLWALSAIVNSGAGSNYKVGYKTSSSATSTCVVKVRNAKYNGMGRGTNTVEADYEIAEADNSGTGIPYLINQFADGASGFMEIADTTERTVSFDGTDSDWNLYSYGNGYRSIGALYDYYNTTDSLSADNRTLKAKIINGNNKTIKVAIDLHELYWDRYHAMGTAGLFTNIRNNVVFNNINITGKIALQNAVAMENSKTVKNVKSNETYTHYYAAGIVGRVEGTAEFNDCSYDELTVIGDFAAAGFLGITCNGDTSKFSVTANWKEDKEIGNSTFKANSPVGIYEVSFIAGLVGRCNADFTINAKSNGNLTIKNLILETTDNTSRTSKAAALVCQTTYASAIKNITVQDCTIAMGQRSSGNQKDIAGGLIGHLRADKGDTKISNISINNCIISGYNSGGLIGEISASGKKVLLEKCMIGNDTQVQIEGSQIGGLIGYAGSPNLKITNCTVGGEYKDSVLLTTKGGKNVGGAIGYCANTSTTVDGFILRNAKITATDNNNSIYTGMILGGQDNNVTRFYNCLIEKNNVELTKGYFGGVAGYIRNGNGKIEGYNILIKDNDISLGKANAGAWVGFVDENNQIRLAGVSFIGTSESTRPRKDIGNLSASVYSTNKSYIASADYLGLQTENDNDNFPYVMNSPSSPWNNADKLIVTDKSGKPITLLGDGIAFVPGSEDNPTSIFAKICNELTQNADNSYYQNCNSLVTDYQAFSDKVLYTKDTTQETTSLNTFASIQEIEDFPDTLDFPVLLIKDESDIVPALDILTNGGFSSAKASSQVDISINTYEYNESTKGFTEFQKGTRPTVILDNGAFTIKPGRTDKGAGKFTLITVTFKFANNGVYTMYVPIIVDKPIDIYFSSYAAVGNEFLTDISEQSCTYKPSQIVTNYGKTASFLLEYRYKFDNWSSIDLNWYFDKTINIDHEMNGAIPKGTHMTLIDLNQDASEKYWYEATATDNLKTLDLCTQFKDWKPVTMSNLAIRDNNSDNVRGMNAERYILLLDFPNNPQQNEGGSTSEPVMRMYHQTAFNCYDKDKKQIETYSNTIHVGEVAQTENIELKNNKYASCMLMLDCEQSLTFVTHESNTTNQAMTMFDPQYEGSPAELTLEVTDKISYGSSYAGRLAADQNTFLDFVFSMQETNEGKNSSHPVYAPITGSVTFELKDKNGNIIENAAFPKEYEFTIADNAKDITLPFGNNMTQYYNLQNVLNQYQNDENITVSAKVVLFYSYEAKANNFPEAPIPKENENPADFVQFFCSARICSSSDMTVGEHKKANDTNEMKYYRAIEGEKPKPKLDFFLKESQTNGFYTAGTNDYSEEEASQNVIKIPAFAQFYMTGIDNPENADAMTCTLTLEIKNDSGEWEALSTDGYLEFPEVDTVTTYTRLSDGSIIWKIDNIKDWYQANATMVNIPLVLQVDNAPKDNRYGNYRVTLQVQLIYVQDGVSRPLSGNNSASDTLIYTMAKICDKILVP